MMINRGTFRGELLDDPNPDGGSIGPAIPGNISGVLLNVLHLLAQRLQFSLKRNHMTGDIRVVRF